MSSPVPMPFHVIQGEVIKITVLIGSVEMLLALLVGSNEGVLPLSR